jgi:hypothetical protein
MTPKLYVCAYFVKYLYSSPNTYSFEASRRIHVLKSSTIVGHFNVELKTNVDPDEGDL